MSDSNSKQSWKQIDWKSTLQYNVMRSVCAIPGWLLLLYVSSKQFEPVMFLLPVVYFAFWLPLGLISSWLSKIGVPLVGLITIISSIVIIFGDPIIWIIHKLKPQLVPIEQPKFIDFHLIVFVIKNPEAIPPCPFKGRVVSDEQVIFMNEKFPLHKTLFIINEDWSVETLKDKYFGFVDINGAVKIGQLQRGVDPRETDIGEMVAYLVDGVCYNTEQQRIGIFDELLGTDIDKSTKVNSETSELNYSEENYQKLLNELSEIAKERKLLKKDFPYWYQVCPYAGNVEVLERVDYLNKSWSPKEIIFDIDYRGFVKTPYDDFFGFMKENGDIMKDSVDDPEKVASIKGSFCYNDIKKIGQFIKQTD